MDTRQLWWLRGMGCTGVGLMIWGLNCTAAYRLYWPQVDRMRNSDNNISHAHHYADSGLRSWNEIEPLSGRLALCVALIALVLLVANKWKALQIVGIAALCVVLYGWHFIGDSVASIPLAPPGIDYASKSDVFRGLYAQFQPEMGVAWWILFAGAILIGAAGWLAEPPELMLLHRWWDVPRRVHKQPLVNDIGTCAQCRQSNSLHAVQCLACGALLPWAKKQRALTPPPGPSQPVPVFIKPKAPAPAVNHDALMLWVYGVPLFLLCLTLPILGFFVWRAMLNTDSELTPFAGAGSFLGIALWLGRFGLIMSRIGTPSNP